MELNSVMLKIRVFVKECWRVLRITKKPNKTEFITIVKASGLGMLIRRESEGWIAPYGH